jgi:hypothetical protein
MIASNCKFESLATKVSFNASVRHVKATVGLAERIQAGENLADAINEQLDQKAIGVEEIPPLISMLLVDKFGYRTAAKNLESVSVDLPAIQELVSGWNAFDIVVLYNHPDLGVMVINPKNKAHLTRIDRLNKTELLVAYLGCFGKPFDQSLAVKAADSVLDLFQGSKVKDNPAFMKGSCVYKAPREPALPKEKKAVAKVKAAKPKPGKQPAAAAQQAVPEPVQATAPKPPQGPKPGARMTPMYSVNVTNELFHNGNVEAWKRIIDSYKVKHPGLDVLVYYDNERIVNLNALFKWGKVKHGSAIQFAVAGDNICDVAKLQRYLSQGASSMFEAFLRGPVNGVLSLF